MSDKVKNQIVVISSDVKEARFEILLPPFRPINMFEVEDNFDALQEEIQMWISDKDIAAAMISFLDSFHEAIQMEDSLPLLEYFMAGNVKQTQGNDLKYIIDSFESYMAYSKDSNRPMH